ncbi:MAG: twin-arginine translocase TatA/TatE family subunit [Anaerolineae bacterium]|nr:twin-arginine translocase TatA/TatE family subunit [Anaerolineae bacterium]
MNLFGIGPGELLLILILALIIFGPNRLPEVARSIGRAINEFRKTSAEVTSAVAKELDLAEAAKDAERPAAPSPAIQPVHSIPLSRVGEVVAPEPPAAQPVPPSAATDPAETRETPAEGGPKQHD